MGDFSDAAGEREMAPKCGSLMRDAGDLVDLGRPAAHPQAAPWGRWREGGGHVPKVCGVKCQGGDRDRAAQKAPEEDDRQIHTHDPSII